jgi:hypothetical protein
LRMDNLLLAINPSLFFNKREYQPGYPASLSLAYPQGVADLLRHGWPIWLGIRI